MMIHVLKRDGRFEYVKPEELSRRLVQHEVLSFERNDGICVVDKDPLRSVLQAAYSGPERRICSGSTSLL